MADDLLAMASAFDLMPFNPHAERGSIRELRVERRRVNPEAWAIVSMGNVLDRDGWWIVERSPSNRDDDHLAACRWRTAREAIAFARRHMEKNPTGYIPEHMALWSRGGGD